MSKQTAVEWLVEEYAKAFKIPVNAVMQETIQQAKEMEKERIKDAYGDGLNAHRTDFCNRDEYYNKTYHPVESNEMIEDDGLTDDEWLINVLKAENDKLKEAINEVIEALDGSDSPNTEWIKVRLINAIRRTNIEGAKWQAERMYSEEEVKDILTAFIDSRGKDFVPFKDIQNWFEKIKKTI